MTCVFLVFCIPMIPGAFSSKTFFGRAVNLVRSWTLKVTSKVTSMKASGSTSQESWPESVESGTRCRGQKLTDNYEQAVNLSALDFDEYEQHPANLVDVEYSRSTKSRDTGTTGPYRHQAVPSDKTILMTTEFEQHDDFVSKTSTGPEHIGTSVSIHG